MDIPRLLQQFIIIYKEFFIFYLHWCIQTFDLDAQSW